MFYHDPRPFWVSEEIKAYKCGGAFGNPSGHSMNTMGHLIIFWLDYYTNSPQGFVMKTCVFLMGLNFVFTIGFSRLILGIHGLD